MLVNLLQRQGRWWLEPQEGRERRVQAPLRTGAGQWWKVHMLQCHHKLQCKEWSGHKGVPKIGWKCSQSENKLPKFQYEQTVFLTCIFMWSLLGEARSTEMKYNMPWQWNLKLLFHLDTKCREICMSLVPEGLKIYYERKTKWTMVCQLAWTLEMILHFQETETSGAFFHHIRGLGLNYVMIGLSKNIYLMIVTGTL